MLQKLNEILKKVKLGKQISILLSLVFLGGLILSGVALSIILENNAQRQIATEAGALLKTMNAVRDYTNTQFTPELSERSKTEFLPQTIPSYTAREVFELVRTNPAWQDYFYKEATLNPSNLRDKADSFETEIVNRFRQDNNLPKLSGFQSTTSGKLFYIAQPIKIEQPSCLECHSTPDRAPKSVIERYGSENGFGWKLNEIVGAKIIYVPASVVFQKARQSFVVVMGTFIVILTSAIWLVNRWLKQAVVRPLRQITQVAEAVSTGNLEAEFESQSNDEIGTLIQAFIRMKTSLVLAMKKLEQYRQK
jgi:HAMP domain-containing protein